MGILYRQEKNGFKHVIEIKNENWKFDTYDDLCECIKCLTTHVIPFSVDYSFELFHIVIPDSKWTREPATQHPSVVFDNDNYFHAVLNELITWKTIGTRPGC